MRSNPAFAALRESARENAAYQCARSFPALRIRETQKRAAPDNRVHPCMRKELYPVYASQCTFSLHREAHVRFCRSKDFRNRVATSHRALPKERCWSWWERVTGVAKGRRIRRTTLCVLLLELLREALHQGKAAACADAFSRNCYPYFASNQPPAGDP